MLPVRHGCIVLGNGTHVASLHGVKIQSNHVLEKLALPAAILVVMLGIAVMAGWYLHIPGLLQIHSSLAPMVFNTALSFLLTGFALLALRFSCPRIARMLAVGVALIGGLTLVQMLTGLDLHIDQIFMQHYVTFKTSTPGRMAPNTALCFFLSGINLWVLAARFSPQSKASINGVLAPAIVALALIALAGYAAGVETAYGWGNLSRMAVHTATGFVVVGVALYGLRPAGVQSSQIPSVGIMLLVLALIGWQALTTREMTSLQNDVNLRAEHVKLNLLTRMETSTQALQRMALRWEKSGGVPEEEWRNDAIMYINDSDYRFLARYTTGTQQQVWVVAEDAAYEANVRAVLTFTACALPVTSWIPNPQLGDLWVEVIPLLVGGRLDGCLMAVRSPTQIISRMRALIGGTPHPLTIWVDGEVMYQEVSDGQWHADTELQIAERNLSLKLTPTKEQLATSWLPVIVLVSGIAATALIMFLMYTISARKQQEAQFSQIVEMAPYGIFLLDADGLIDFVNKEAERLFGYPGGELLGQAVPILGLQCSTDPQGVDAGVAPSEMAVTQSLEGLHKDGPILPIDVRFSSVGHGRLARMILMVIDMRESIAAQRSIAAHVADLTRINEELNNFAYIASHDLKSPLRGIDQLATWIVEDMGDALSAPTREHLRLMRTRIKRMERLLDDLLAYSRAGKSGDKAVTVDTRELVKDIFDLTAATTSIRLDAAEDMPVLHTRKVPLDLIFRNLISNAIKHHDKGEGSITVSARTVGDKIEFSVKDDGPGIAQEHQQRVFGMFQTLKPRDEVEGSGMGLALVKKAVESVGGSVVVESDGLNGSTFRFTWPSMMPSEGVG